MEDLERQRREDTMVKEAQHSRVRCFDGDGWGRVSGGGWRTGLRSTLNTIQQPPTHVTNRPWRRCTSGSRRCRPSSTSAPRTSGIAVRWSKRRAVRASSVFVVVWFSFAVVGDGWASVGWLGWFIAQSGHPLTELPLPDRICTRRNQQASGPPCWTRASR